MTRADDTDLPAGMSREERDGRSVLRVVGQLDVSNAAAFRGAINGLVLDGRVDLVIDLREVTFLDSVILGVLVATHRKVRAFKGSLTLVAADGPLPALLRITGLDRFLRRVATLDDV